MKTTCSDETRWALLADMRHYRTNAEWCRAHGVSKNIVSDALNRKSMSPERENILRRALGIATAEEVASLENEAKYRIEIAGLNALIKELRDKNAAMRKEMSLMPLVAHDYGAAENGYADSDVRDMIFRRDLHCCRYCGDDLSRKPFHIDHVYPRSLGGVDHPDNLVTSCPACNSRKGGKLGIWPLPIGYFGEQQ